MAQDNYAGRNKVDYANRTVDLLLLKTILRVPIYQRVNIDVSDVSGEPMIVSGIEKMVQRFALSFLNALGSTKFRSEYGTNLIPQVAMGRVYDMPTLEAVAAEANMIARLYVRQGDAGEDTPDDEKLVDSEVIGLEFSREKASVKISIKLTSATGESYVYIIPVPIGVRS